MGMLPQTGPDNIGCTEEKIINFNAPPHLTTPCRLHSMLTKIKSLWMQQKNPFCVSHRMRYIRVYQSSNGCY